MKFDVGILRLANDLAGHASARQAVISENIANADTPGYKARDLENFANSFTDHRENMRTTRPARSGHIPLENAVNGFSVREDAAFGAEAPNGNTVSLEDQMIRSAEVRQQHDLALGIYRKSLDILRAGMGRIR